MIYTQKKGYKMRMGIFIFAVFLSSRISLAEIIDFSALPSGGAALVTPFDQGNFRITTSSNAHGDILTTPLPDLSYSSLGLFQNNALQDMTLSITRIGGGLFNLLGFDWGFDALAGSATLNAASTVNGIGGGGPETFANSGSRSDTLFSTFSPTVGFNGSGISQLDFFFSSSPGGGGQFGLDNIELALVGAPPTVVPEPSSFAMLFAGSLGAYFVRRRRQDNVN